MKKFLLIFAFLGLFTLVAPKIATPAEGDCNTFIMACPDGTMHYVVICEPEDWYAWGELLCGMVYNN